MITEAPDTAVRRSSRLAARERRSWAAPSRRRRGTAAARARTAIVEEPGASDDFARCGGVSAAVLAEGAEHSRRFAASCRAFLRDLVMCGWCARGALGGVHSRHRQRFSTRAALQVPPTVAANPHLLDYMVKGADGGGGEGSDGEAADAGDADATADDDADGSGDADADEDAAGNGDEYWICSACANSSKRRSVHAMWWQQPAYDFDDPNAGDLAREWCKNFKTLVTLPPGAVLMLSLLRCGVRYAKKIMGYAFARFDRTKTSSAGRSSTWTLPCSTRGRSPRPPTLSIASART